MLTSASFLRTHGRGVGECADLVHDRCDRVIREAGLALLNEIGVLGHARHVVDQQHAVARAPGAQLPQVGHRHRLAARHVDTRGEADVRNAFGAHVRDQRIELRQVDVALERMLALRVVRLVDDHVDERAAGQFLVQPGGREVHVPGHMIARLDEQLGQDVLGAAALVRGHHVPIAVAFAHGGFEVVEVGAAGVGLVAEHHAGPLPVAHGRDAGIGQQVDIDVLRAQQEGVVAGRHDGAVAMLAGRGLEQLDHLDLVGLCPGAAAGKGACSHVVSRGDG